MSQTSYAEQSSAQPGQLGNLSLKKVSSYVAAAALEFGTGVCLGSDKEKQVAAPAAETDVTDMKKWRGIVLKEHTIENKADGLTPRVEAKRPISVMEKGECWVKVVEDVVPTDAVYCIHTGSNIGQFRNDADTDNADLVPNARFRSNSITVDGVKIALLELY